MLTTRDPNSDELHSRAMYPASTDSLEFVFFGNQNSGKFEGIEKDHVRPPYTSHLSLSVLARLTLARSPTSTSTCRTTTRARRRGSRSPASPTSRTTAPRSRRSTARCSRCAWIEPLLPSCVSSTLTPCSPLLWRPPQAWFGDLGDGKHDGSASDPRIELIEVTPKEIRYFLETKGTVAKTVDIVTSAVTGSTAAPGVLRTLKGHELETAKTLVGNAVKL